MFLRFNLVALAMGLFLSSWAHAFEQEEPEVEYFFSARERVTIGVMGLKSGYGMEQKQVDVIGDLIAEHISKLGDMHVVSKADIVSMLNLEKQKRLAGCTDQECFSEIVGRLGMPWMVTGNLSTLGSSIILNLKLIDVRNAYVAGRASRRIKGDLDDLLDELPEVVEELFEKVSDQLGLGIEKRVITAARHSQRISESPSMVIVITRRDIEESGATTLSELLRLYPPVHVHEFDPLFPVIQIRGSAAVLLTIDGRDINPEFYPIPFYVPLPNSLHEIERVEIVLGPNSALYGANAVSSVINVITRTPGRAFRSDLFLAGGEHGTTQTHGIVEGGFGPVTLRGSVGTESANGWSTRGEPAKDLFRGNFTTRLELDGGYAELNGGVAAGSGRLFSTLGYVEFDRFYFAHAKANVEISDFKAQTYWYRLFGVQVLDLDLVYPGSGIILGEFPKNNNTVDILQVDSQYKLELFTGNLLVAGADYRMVRVSCNGIVDPVIFEHRVGLFLHDEQWLGDRVLLTVGARLDYNSVSDTAVSPRAALVYNPAGEHFLRLSAGTAFRKPTTLEISANLKVEENPAFPEIGTLFKDPRYGLSNPDLKNEVLTTVELGYRGVLLDGMLQLNLNASLGFNRKLIAFNNYVRFQGFQIDLEGSNLGHDNSGNDNNFVGMTLGLELNPADWLGLFFRGSYLHMWTVEKGEEVPRIPAMLLAAGLRARLPRGITASLSVSHASERDYDTRDPESVLAPSIWMNVRAKTLLQLALNYRYDLERASLDLGARLFNPFGGRFRDGAGVTDMSGRSYGAELIGARAMLTAGLRY